MASVIVVFSANGGMGKSVFSSNVSYGLTTFKKKVLLVEAGFGNRSDDIILGINSDSIYTFSDICLKNCKPREAVIKSEKLHIPDLISAGPVKYDADTEMGISDIINTLSPDYDYIVLDLSSSFDKVFDCAVKKADIAIALTDDSFISVRNTSLVMTRVRELGCKKSCLVLNNVIIDGDLASLAAEDIADETGEMILGIIPRDEFVKLSIQKSDPIYNYNTYAGRSFENICRRIMGGFVSQYETGVSSGLFSKNKFILKHTK